ncbi:MAG: phosphoribosylanthranilate isomerase [Lachnospiraceae bacterium]|nr:phosphoribosylanthranilate isomerase [Lachnospiraceae bacterium]
MRIKICGLMNAEDCRVINRCRPDYAGFVFADTRHRISDETAAELRENLDAGIPAVGVFVDDEPAHIASLIAAGTIQIVQLHGHEDAAYIARLRELIMETVQDRRWRTGTTETGTVPIIRAFRLPAEAFSETLAGLEDRIDCLLLDTAVKGVPGGSGKRFDLSLVPAKITKPWFLAGGLTPDNIAQVLEELRTVVRAKGGQMPFAVDVSSGVESERMGGHKDDARTERFCEKVRTLEMSGA